MRAVFRFTGHVLWAMVKGFVFTGVVAAALCFGVLFAAAPGHHLTLDLSAVFAIVISVLAATLGSAVALIYHLSHLEEVTQAIRRREAQRQQARR
jgi:putative flippase GtrA